MKEENHLAGRKESLPSRSYRRTAENELLVRLSSDVVLAAVLCAKGATKIEIFTLVLHSHGVLALPPLRRRPAMLESKAHAARYKKYRSTSRQEMPGFASKK